MDEVVCDAFKLVLGMSLSDFLVYPEDAISQWMDTGGYEVNGVFKEWFEKNGSKYNFLEDF